MEYIGRALLSLSDQGGLITFAQGLAAERAKLISTGNQSCCAADAPQAG